MVRGAPHGDLERWFFRVERQTLRRLELTGAVVVTIRNYVASTRPRCDQYEDFGSRLLYYLDPTPAPMRDDKGWCGGADRLRFAPSER